MKRKLDENNVPREIAKSKLPQNAASFTEYGFDPRILQGVSQEKLSAPTPVQREAIPLALQGKSILARAKTGSGKTLAYLLPILQSVLRRRSESTFTKNTSALILVPYKELAEQVTKVATTFAQFCGQSIRVENLARTEDEAVQRARLADFPDVVVSTPAPVAKYLKAGVLDIGRLVQLVIDEADTIFDYDTRDDVQEIATFVPKGIQLFLMSATLATDLDDLKGIFNTQPVVLELDEEEKEDKTLTQYMVKCAEEEKFLLAFAIFKFKLIKGKFIVFVGDIDRGYRLKLFLEQFGIKSCVLNSELPVNSRIHVVQEFNKDVYDIIIASDEQEVLGNEGKVSKNEKGEAAEESTMANGERPSKKQKKESGNGSMNGLKDSVDGANDEVPAAEAHEAPKKHTKNSKRDAEYGISRGIDFKNVTCVLNFDLPTSSKSYTHRVGRTARAGKSGMALSFVIPSSQYRKHKPTTFPSTKDDEVVLAKIIKSQTKKGQEVKDFSFDMKQLEGFRYRMADALRAVTRLAVREARTRELRQELLKSEKLKRHFEENPEDLKHLRHDSELRAARVQPHLRHVPEYLMPKGGKKSITGEGKGTGGFVGLRKEGENRIRRARMANKMKGKGKRGSAGSGRKSDPLKTFGKGKR